MEEKAMKLLGLVWAKADPEDIKAAAQAVMSEQRPDGGWAQLPALESDAYATGQALTALHAAGQITVDDQIYNRGAAFLLRTQRPDGSWLVRTPFVPISTLQGKRFPARERPVDIGGRHKLGHDGADGIASSRRCSGLGA